MKKILVLVFMAFVVNVVAFAQTYPDVVYLKNGSVIRGVIVEQIPGVSLKIQTADGSIFAYQMDEVEKITKEVTASSTKTKTRTTYADNGYKLKNGYRGFVDVGYSYPIRAHGAVYRPEFSTSHGYQISPWLFAGGGIGVHYCWHYEAHGSPEYLEIPIFADVRTTLPCRSICQPFINFKIGYAVLKHKGVYMSPSIGCRFAVSARCGINLSIGYSMQKQKIYDSRSYNRGKWVLVDGSAITPKIGFDF